MDETNKSVGDQKNQELQEHSEEAEHSTEVERVANQPVYGESYDEEYAQEAAVPVNEPIRSEEAETNMEEEVKSGMAWVGLAAAILSFFFAPFLLGIVGIVFGVIGKRRGADTLGNMAIIISIVSILFSLFLAPVTQMF
ncbi:DUF4190 domain-containing protein [Halobacillus sp. Marseille-P3879]|uniref:DUF4190 domain-containing protein n=1 Tax=Halobacillus sp. Marseille-P3879 TaxID=2045014 RepID=UPI000C7CE941|nr:DUF4190 domain-containing protein [Halobacillus sp. Marseille-P3879]